MIIMDDISKWLDATEENKEYILNKYGEVYVYKDKIVPRDKLTPKLKEWFRS